jgi:DNA-binding HxlR family transcriptional regulator
MAKNVKPAAGTRRVRGSRTAKPIMVLLDTLGRRWALRIVWELSRAETPLNFRQLQTVCGGLSPSVLNQRLGELRALMIVEVLPDGYALTPSGRALTAPLLELSAWAERHIPRASGPTWASARETTKR